MKTINNTILITGGSAGIGYEMAKLLSQNNQVIITGRDKERLAAAAEKLNIRYVLGDVSDAADVDRLVKEVYETYPTLNILINNAGKAEVYRLSDENGNAFENASKEILVNYLSIVRLSERLLPLLKKQSEAAIVNVSSIASIVPGLRLPTYAASKAALHSYSQSLRLTLELVGAPVKVFELRPPLVDTEFSAGIGGSAGIPSYVVADELLTAMAEDRYDVRVGRTEDMYKLYLQSPEQALLAMNAPALKEAGIASSN